MLGRILRTIPDSFTPNIDSKSLKEKIKSSTSPVIEHNFGLALGSIFFIRPDSSVDLEALVEQIHKQPEAQKSRANMAWIVGGPILSSRSGKDAIRHHKLFVNSLSRPDDYIKFTLEALAQFNITSGKKLTLRQLTTAPVYNLLSKGLLGLDELPSGLTTAFDKFSDIVSGKPTADDAEDDQPVTDALTNFSKNNFNILRSMYYPKLLSLMPVFSDARENYIKAAKAFIIGQMGVIKAQILEYAANKKITNILAVSIIEMVKEINPELYENRNVLNKYLQDMVNDEEETVFRTILSDDYIHTVPGNLFAALNLRDLIPSILYALTTNPGLTDSLREDFKKYNLEGDLSNIRKVIEDDKRDNGILHRIYLEGLRLRSFNKPLEELQFGTLFRYYITNPITVNNTTIPGGSVICILNGMTFVNPEIWGDKPETFNPARFFGTKEQLDKNPAAKIPFTAFSRSPRVCPAHIVTEYITKAFISSLVMNYELTLHAKPKESSISKVKLEFTERKLDQVEIIGGQRSPCRTNLVRQGDL